MSADAPKTTTSQHVPRSAPARPGLPSTAARYGPIVVVLVAVALLAERLHLRGHNWGDDFTLYLRQARSLVDGNVGEVIANNRFNVLNAAKPGFSPTVYPWTFPVLLAPFVRLWGFDVARLKMLEVAFLVAWLGFFYAVLRRRAGRWLALAVVAYLGTSLDYLRHTDQVLSELPYMMLVAATLWWLDRCRHHGRRLDQASRAQLITLGLLAMAVFNTRREGLALMVGLLAVQLVDLRGRRGDADLRRAATPLVTFVVSVVLGQFMLPSALAPEYDGSGLGQTWKKLRGPFQDALNGQLGLGTLPKAALAAIALLAVAGMVIRLRRATADDISLAVFAVLSMTIAGSIPAVTPRYLMAVTPFVVYFAAQALVALARLVPGRVRVVAPLAVAALVSVGTVVHVTKLPDALSQVADFDDSGRVVDGPFADYAVAGFEAIRHYTHQDDVVGFFKARSMTLFTNRRAVQSSDLQVMRERADYFLMRRNSDYSQPLVTDAQAATMGWTSVWTSDQWVLWRLPRWDATQVASDKIDG